MALRTGCRGVKVAGEVPRPKCTTVSILLHGFRWGISILVGVVLGEVTEEKHRHMVFRYL